MVRTGAFGYLQYGYEMCFATEASSIVTVFGLEQKVTNWTLTNNRITLAALNQIEPAVYAYGTTRGSLGIDFVLSNPFWLSTLYDTVATMCGCPTAGTNTHTYTNPTKLRQSISIEIGTEQGATDVVRTLLGGVVNSIALRSTIGEVVRGSADISYASEIEGCAIDASPATDADNFPYTFAYGNLTTSAGTIANLQSFDININQNSDLLYTHNTSVADTAYRKLFEITGSFTATYVDNDLLRDLYAQAHVSSGVGLDSEAFAREQATLTLVFDNGLTAVGTEKRITLTGTGVGFADHSVSIEPNEPIFETLNWQIRSLAPVALNQSSTPACA